MLRAGALVASAIIVLAACGGSDSKGGVQVSNRTPQACLDALDKAESIISDAGDGFSLTSDAIDAALALDETAAGVVLGRMHALSEGIGVKVDEYKVLASECRG